MTTSGGTPTSCCGSRSSSSLIGTGRRAAEGLIGLCFPPQCVLCGRRLESLRILCPECEAGLPELLGSRCRRCGEALHDASLNLCLRCGTRERAVDRFHSLGPYDGPWGELVRALKFGKEAAVGRFLAGRMAGWIRLHGVASAFDLVTFVPMSSRDHRERGFNQAELLARGVAKRLRRPVCRILTKVRVTPPQRRLTARERRANLRDAFRLLRYGVERVLLVDDISTTGSTVEECARALKRGGYESVVVLTVARA
jgi:competence protein ComFC